MKEPDLKKIRKAMEKELDPKRYEHTPILRLPLQCATAQT